MEHISVVISVWMMALALSMDAFSVSLSFGMQNLRLKRIALFGFMIGVLHMILPFIGMTIGHFLSERASFITELTSGFILLALGAHMFFAALQRKPSMSRSPKGWKLVVVAFFVSVDSFPAGVSISFIDVEPLLMMLTFGLCAMVMAWIGMMLGKKTHAATGKYSEMLGGLILYFIGLIIVFY